MSTELMALPTYQKPLTAIEIRAQVNLIQEVMKAVMKENTHYGVIPGCKKPSLWKPGAEVLFTTFHIFVDPAIEDLSTSDEARFRVMAHAKSAAGFSLGSAVGEASSDEEKYKWREIVCQEEWDATPENQRRTKWKSGRANPYCVYQVRANIADCRNTVLKMAAKRASVALALQVTAASDIFTQDIEDLPAEMQGAAINGDAHVEPPLPTEIKRKEPAPSAVETPAPVAPASPAAPVRPSPVAAPRPEPQAAKPPIQSPKAQTARVISEAQARRFYAIRKGTGWSDQETKNYLRETFGTEDDRQIPAAQYEKACEWASAKGF